MERRTENRESSRRERETERYRHRQTDKERERRVNSGAAPVTKTINCDTMEEFGLYSNRGEPNFYIIRL